MKLVLHMIVKVRVAKVAFKQVKTKELRMTTLTKTERIKRIQRSIDFLTKFRNQLIYEENKEMAILFMENISKKKK